MLFQTLEKTPTSYYVGWIFHQNSTIMSLFSIYSGPSHQNVVLVGAQNPESERHGNNLVGRPTLRLRRISTLHHTLFSLWGYPRARHACVVWPNQAIQNNASPPSPYSYQWHWCCCCPCLSLSNLCRWSRWSPFTALQKISKASPPCLPMHF